jgi:iron complex outermembrane receptor protein
LRSFEAGARGALERWRLRYELVGYRSTLKNAFVAFQRPDSRTYYANAAESSRDGVEALLEWRPVARLRTRLAYTYQDFSFARFVSAGVDYSGKHEPGTPPHQLSAQGTYVTSFGLLSTAQFRWVDAYPVDNANTFANWSYRVVDLRFGFTHGLGFAYKNQEVGFRPFVGIDNLFNKRYNAATSPNAFGNRFYDPAPGRTFYVGMTIAAGRS